MRARADFRIATTSFPTSSFHPFVWLICVASTYSHHPANNLLPTIVS
jgi:hypothetical protein